MMMWPAAAVLWIMLFNFEEQWAVYDTGPFFDKQICQEKIKVYEKERADLKLKPIQFICAKYEIVK